MVGLRLLSWKDRSLHFLHTKFHRFGLFLSYCIEKIHYGRVYTAPLVFRVFFPIQMFQQLSGSLFGDGQVYVKDEEPKDGQTYDGANY